MAQLALPLMIVSSAISAGGTILGGMEADAAGKAQQKQYEAAANTERALSQRQAIEKRREAQLAESRAIAVSAASGGGGAETPGVADILSGINQQGEMNALTSLWEGEEKARGLEYAGKTARWQGKQQKKASYFSAATTLIGGRAGAAGSPAGQSFFSQYGGGGAPFTGVGARPY